MVVVIAGVVEVVVAVVMVMMVPGVVVIGFVVHSRCYFSGWLWFHVLLWLQVLWLVMVKSVVVIGLISKPFRWAWDYTFDDGHNHYSHEYVK